MEATPCENPAHNGETHTVGKPVNDGQCRGKPSACVSRYGPVTTDPFGERRRSLSHPLASVRVWQIYGRRNTRALNLASWTYRRISPDMILEGLDEMKA